jgi:hypothetical protein
MGAYQQTASGDARTFAGRMRPTRKGSRYSGAGLRTTKRAAAHSLQFGTYALWTAGLLAALAVRPVPSCTVGISRGVNDQGHNDACSGQTAVDVSNR